MCEREREREGEMEKERETRSGICTPAGEGETDQVSVADNGPILVTAGLQVVSTHSQTSV